MMTWRSGFVMSAVAALMLGGCQESPSSPGNTEPGSLAMSDGGGGFEASGAPTLAGNEVVPGTFAIAFPDSIGGVVVSAFRQTVGTRGDLFILQIKERRQGVFDPCDIFRECYGRLLEDIDAANLSDVGRGWEIIDGSVDVQTIQPDRIVGSFKDLVLESPVPDSSAAGSTNTERRDISDGTFDLPLMSEEEGAAAMRCFLARATGAQSC